MARPAAGDVRPWVLARRLFGVTSALVGRSTMHTRRKRWRDRVSPLLAALLILNAASSMAKVVPWTPGGVSSPQFESHAAFDPTNGDFYFVRSSPKFEGWRILVSHCAAQGWSEPAPPTFAGDGVEADPWFTPDGRTLFFISTRSTDGVKRKDLDIWQTVRTNDRAWRTPVRLPEPRQLQRAGMVSQTRARRLALLWLWPRRRPRQDRHLAGACRCAGPLDRRQSRPGDQHGGR